MSKTALFFSPEGGNVHGVADKLGEMIGNEKVDIMTPKFALGMVLFMLLAPGCVFLIFFFLLPLLVVFSESLQGPEGGLMIDRYKEVLQDSQFRKVYLRTIISCSPTSMRIDMFGP